MHISHRRDPVWRGWAPYRKRTRSKRPSGVGRAGTVRRGKEIPSRARGNYVPVLPVGRSLGLMASKALCADCRPRRSSRRAASSGRSAPGKGRPSSTRFTSATRDHAAAQDARAAAEVCSSSIVLTRMRWMAMAWLRSRRWPLRGFGVFFGGTVAAFDMGVSGTLRFGLAQALRA